MELVGSHGVLAHKLVLHRDLRVGVKWLSADVSLGCHFVSLHLSGLRVSIGWELFIVVGNGSVEITG